MRAKSPHSVLRDCGDVRLVGVVRDQCRYVQRVFVPRFDGRVCINQPLPLGWTSFLNTESQYSQTPMHTRSGRQLHTRICETRMCGGTSARMSGVQRF